MEAEELEVIVVDDHLAMRRGIELLLREAGFRIAGVAGTLDEARAILSRRRFDVALLDVQLGQQSSVGLVEDLLREDPTAPIVFYTGYTGADAMLHEAVRAGARGFVLKTSPTSRLTGALRAVAAGGTYVDPELAGQLAEDGELQRLRALSARELEVLLLLDQHLGTEEIAQRLFISDHTVRSHVKSLLGKLGVSSRREALEKLNTARG